MERERVTCPHVYRGDECLKKATQAQCPMYAIGCIGCVNTGYTRLIPVQGSSEKERQQYVQKLAQVGADC